MGATLSNVKQGCGCDATDVKKAEQIKGPNGKAVTTMTDAEALDVLKKALKEKFAKRSDAFDALGAGDDGHVDKDELTEFLRKDLGLGDVAPRIFSLLDVDKNGYITKEEFKSFGAGDEPAKKGSSKSTSGNSDKANLKDFKKFLKSKFKKPEEAFKGLDDDDSKEVTIVEFTTFMENSGYSGDTQSLFKLLDANKDGSLTYKEFKKQLSAPD